MGKNYWIALGLSMLVLLGYPTFLKWIYPPQEAPVSEEAAYVSGEESPAIAPPVVEQAVSEIKESITPQVKSEAQKNQQFIPYENEQFSIEFSTLGGTISKLFYKGEAGREALTENFFYNGNVTQKNIFQTKLLHAPTDLSQANFKFARRGAREEVFEFSYEEPGDYKLTKRYLVGRDHPSIHLEVEMSNLGTREKHFPLEMTYGMDFSFEKKQEEHFVQGVVSADKVRTGSLGKMKKKGFQISEEIKWSGLLKKYFSVLVRPDNWETIDYRATAVTESTLMATVRMKPITLSPNARANKDFLIYAGPQRHQTLKSLGFESLASRGFFGIFKTAIFSALEFFYKYTHNYGWAIIIVTLIIKGLFTPLTHMSFENMKKMQAIQPKLKNLQERHKKDPAKLNKEMMELYKRNKVNPMMGCLPMLLQIPIFIAFYQGLAEAIELKGAPWIFWITDLSEPDKLFTLPFSIPMLGDGFNILPLLMIGSMVWQQKLTPTVGTSPEQAKMMALMPLIFGVLFYNMPSGLVLYWFVNNVLSIVHQVFVKRIVVVLHHEDRDDS